MKTKKYLSLPTKLTIAIAIFFGALFLIVSFMFLHTGSVMENEAIKRIEFNANDISSGIDEIILNIYNVSDAFALDERLQKYTNKELSGNPIEKRFITTQISNVLFASYDLLRKNERMAAFYNNSTKEVYNFLDPNADDRSCKTLLLSMGINNPDKLAKFSWYSVRDNFLKTDKTGNIRKDSAVIGSRRIFSQLYNSYIGIHIFALNEEVLYNKYHDVLKQYNADIFIITGDGSLLSASDISVLKSGSIDSQLKNLIINREFDRFNYNHNMIFVKKSEINDWLTVICVPETSLTDVVDKLYKWVFIVIIVFAVLACVLIFMFYKSFMHPISLLNTSMKQVHYGNLKAYVDVTVNNELGQMISYYNTMLESVNENIKARLKVEQHKKQLETDVLMNQINPHFLYNTLETIVWKSSEAGHPDIGRMAAALGRMYRLSISGGKLFISMSQELEHVNAFIKIQQNRYEDSFVFDIKADHGALHNYYTLKILLQPLVENSLSHGMEGLDRVLNIRLSVKVCADHLFIRITDTGTGMDKIKLGKVRRQILTGHRDEQAESPVRKKSTGIGMHNVYERLKLYFKDSADISIWSKRNIGTVITLHLPLISQAEAEKLNFETHE